MQQLSLFPVRDRLARVRGRLFVMVFCIRQNPSLLNLAQFTPLFVDLVTSAIHNPDFLFSYRHDFLLSQFDDWLSSSALDPVIRRNI